MALKIKVSKEGYDVLKETDPRNFIFDSDYNHLKTAGSGTIQKTLGNSSNTTETVAHGLGYRPLVLCYWKEDSEGKWRLSSTNPERSEFRPNTNSNVGLNVTATNIVFQFWNGNGSGGDRDYTAQYEFFYEGDQ